MNLNKISGYDLIALASSLSIFIGEQLSSNDLAILASFFSALGDNLGIISASKS